MTIAHSSCSALRILSTNCFAKENYACLVYTWYCTHTQIHTHTGKLITIPSNSIKTGWFIARAPYRLTSHQQVVKIIPHKVPSPPQTDDSIVFARWRQCGLPSGNTTELVLFRPTKIHNPNGKSIGSAVFAQLPAESPYTLQWASLFPLKIAPSHGRSGPPSKTRFLEPIRAQNPNNISIASALFAQMTAECPYLQCRYTLQWAASSPPLKIVPSHGGM